MLAQGVEFTALLRSLPRISVQLKWKIESWIIGKFRGIDSNGFEEENKDSEQGRPLLSRYLSSGSGIKELAREPVRGSSMTLGACCPSTL